jgi:pfkB family carbohydrate kinase.
MEGENKKKILIIGAAVIDIVVRVERLPKSGEDVYGIHQGTVIGGCAFNVAQAIRRFSLDHTLLVPVGKGPHADLIRKELRRRYIPIILEDDSQDNGWNISLVEPDGERTFLSVPGLETSWRDSWFETIHFSGYDFIYLSGYELEGPSGEVIARQIRKKKPSAKIILDPGPRVSHLDGEVLGKVLSAGTIVHCNEQEIGELAPGNSIEEAANILHGKTGEAVVVTLGKQGCFYTEGKQSGIVPARPLKASDTIGAGDAHTGAFLSGLAMGYSLEEACRMGNEVAAEVIQSEKYMANHFW